MSDVAEMLDALVPRHEGAGDWDRVLRDAGIRRRALPTRARLTFRVAAAAAVAAAIAAAVSLWPAGGPGPTVLERALAAAGDGQVLHFVYEADPPKTLVNLETGERTELRAQHEVWFDPQAGVRETERFDGVVQFDVFLGPDEISEHARTLYTGLGAGYRDALESGRAEVVGEDVVDGTAVYWIRGGAGAHDVAVSRDTFAPAYIRVEQNGTSALTRIVAYETVERVAAPVDSAPADAKVPPGVGTYGAAIELADAAERLGRAPVWAGPSLHGFPLGSVREVRLPSSAGDVPGVSVAYGSVEDGPHVELTQAATPADALTMLAGVRGYVPPEGTALLSGVVALLRSNGVVVAVHAPDEAMALDVARSLRPYTG
jgi:hypothetical protein